MGARRREPLLGRPRRCARSSSTSTRETGRYRRFFDIDDLAGVRAGGPGGLRGHPRARSLELVREGVVDGLRIDHPDGLADPAGYLRAAARRGRRARLGREDPRPRRAAARLAGGRDGRLRVPQRRRGAVRRPGRRGAADRPLGRALRRRRAVRRGRARGQARAGDDDVRAARSSGCARCATDRRHSSRRAGGAAGLPHVRRAVDAGASRPTTARRSREAGIDGRLRRRAPARASAGRDEFVTRFQQTTPPVMAKGVEDTAFYRYVRLLALNDVGGDPARFGLCVADFHAANAIARASASRAACSSPRRTTRSARGDVRARIGALAGMAAEWREHVRRWREVNAGAARRRRARRQRGVPDLPDARRRLADRGRAARRPTSRRRCARPSATRPGSSRTTTGRRRCQALRAWRCSTTGRSSTTSSPSPRGSRDAGRARALGQLLLKLTVARASPDIYQGDELLALCARRPRQPPPGRLGRAPRRARRPARRRRADATRR